MRLQKPRFCQVQFGQLSSSQPVWLSFVQATCPCCYQLHNHQSHSRQSHSRQSHLRPLGCGISLGIALAIPVTAAIAQPDELQQLDDFLSPPAAAPSQLQPAPPTQPLQFAPSPPSSSAPAIPPPPPAVVLPPSVDQPQFMTLSLNSHSPGTLGSPRQLQEGFYQDRFQFEGQSGELILLNLIGSDDPRMQLDPRLQLIGPDGSIVAEDDNSGYNSARGDARIVLSLPDTGSYTIVVTTAEPDDRGRYTLGLLEVDDPSTIQ